MDIDVVVMWVDGNDPEWLKEKRKYSPEKQDDSNSTNRFRDWNLMKYWFRAIEKNMPWVRKIFFVTWGHVPAFLNLSNPKLRVVKHDEYIPKQYLPTFSANPIELNLHRIQDLSENFVLFNDDMFVLKPLKKSYFFKNNMPCGYYAEQPVDLVGKLEVWQHLVINDIKTINKYFDKRRKLLEKPTKYFNLSYSLKDNIKSILLMIAYSHRFTGFKILHTVNAYSKNTYRELWEKEYDLLDRTSKNKFRNKEDVNQWLLLWWQIATGFFTPTKMSPGAFDIVENNISNICDDIIHQKYEIICINDPTENVDFYKLESALHDAFDKLFPEKSSFEK